MNARQKSMHLKGFTMQEISEGAQALSTYGLYTIVAVLAVVVVFLYKRVVDLEKELRTTLSSTASETSKLLAQTNEALKDNTKAFCDFQVALMELKTTVQLALERMKND